MSTVYQRFCIGGFFLKRVSWTSENIRWHYMCICDSNCLHDVCIRSDAIPARVLQWRGLHGGPDRDRQQGEPVQDPALPPRRAGQAGRNIPGLESVCYSPWQGMVWDLPSAVVRRICCSMNWKHCMKTVWSNFLFLPSAFYRCVFYIPVTKQLHETMSEEKS